MSIEKEKVLKELYQRNKDKVYNTVFSMVKNTEDAEEITQDVFIKAYENLDSFRGESQESTWLYRIAVNKSIDLIRSRKTQKRFSWLTSLFDPESGKILHDPTDFDHPGIQFEKKEDAQILFQAIDNLPEKQQAAYILFNLEGLPYQEVAAVMEVSVSSVESLIFRAKQNLKKQLEKVLEK